MDLLQHLESRALFSAVSLIDLPAPDPLVDAVDYMVPERSAMAAVDVDLHIAPPSPSGLTATLTRSAQGKSLGSAHVQWHPVDSALRYTLWRSFDGSQFASWATMTAHLNADGSYLPASTSYDDPAILKGHHTFVYEVAAYNFGGWSPFSAPVTLKT